MCKALWIAAGLGLPLFAAAANIDINSADEDTLTELRGIGPARAQAIVDEREGNGPFRNEADLASRIKGIGPKTVKRLLSEGMVIGVSAEQMPETPAVPPVRQPRRRH